jgi:DNA-binding MarR family transcriptional regulator
MAKSKSGAKAAVAALERSPSHLLHRALQRALDIYAEEFGAGAITQRQFAVLAAAAEREGATQADLVRITGIDRSTLADMVQRMIGKDLLERERSVVDARANAVRLTGAGQVALTEAAPKMAAADGKLLKLVGGSGRRSAFVDLLRDLVARGESGGAAAVKPPKPPKPPKAPKPPKPAKASKVGAKVRKKAKKKTA